MYSDLGFMLLQRMVEAADQSLDQYVDQQFLTQPLGLESMTFTSPGPPVPENIAPTETDTYFRQQEVRGMSTIWPPPCSVERAAPACSAMPATWASSSRCCSTDGVYGRCPLPAQPGTIRRFTTRPLGQDRRGWGFDIKKGQGWTGTHGHVSNLVSDRAFGTWVYGHLHPTDHDLGISSSNRTWPSMTPNRLQERSLPPADPVNHHRSFPQESAPCEVSTLFLASRWSLHLQSTNAIHVLAGLSILGMGTGLRPYVLVMSVFNGFESLVFKLVQPIQLISIFPGGGQDLPSDSLWHPGWPMIRMYCLGAGCSWKTSLPAERSRILGY